jgi:FkbM family methyltransferase
MNLKPLWLREKIFWKFYAQNINNFSALFNKANLEFSPNTSLELMETDIGHRMVAFTGFYELPLSRLISNLAKSGGLLVDVGANYGYYTCLWASLNSNNQVVAYEASPRNSQMLLSNLKFNKLESQVQIHEVAVGKEKGKLQFDLGPSDQSGWGGLSIEKSYNTVEVPVVSLDDCFENQNTVIDVLKIDTEGADTWVIEGSRHLLKSKKIKHIFFEENLSRMSNLKIDSGITYKILSEHGYQIKKIANNEWHAWLVS